MARRRDGEPVFDCVAGNVVSRLESRLEVEFASGKQDV
jgi:hypothetical protein